MSFQNFIISTLSFTHIKICLYKYKHIKSTTGVVQTLKQSFAYKKKLFKKLH